MLDIAGWIAPAATMSAAIMTASNLGARVTGWGFAVFSVGALAWIVVGAQTGQHNLLWSNAFLLLVDLIGVWRWLGRRARYDSAAEEASARSAAAPEPTLFPLAGLDGRAVQGESGDVIATAVDAMARSADGRIVYLVVREGGIGGVGERLHALSWDEVRVKDGAILTHLSSERLAQRQPLDPAQWPAVGVR